MRFGPPPSGAGPRSWLSRGSSISHRTQTITVSGRDRADPPHQGPRVAALGYAPKTRECQRYTLGFAGQWASAHHCELPRYPHPAPGLTAPASAVHPAAARCDFRAQGQHRLRNPEATARAHNARSEHRPQLDAGDTCPPGCANERRHPQPLGNGQKATLYMETLRARMDPAQYESLDQPAQGVPPPGAGPRRHHHFR